MTWNEAVRNALRRFSQRHNTSLITRKGLIEEELESIVKDADSSGVTPDQTLSRILQELRDEGILWFTEDGRYLLVEKQISITNEELPDDAIDFSLKKGLLMFKNVETDTIEAKSLIRRGQNRLRNLTLQNYNSTCCCCDIDQTYFLVASHISRWADDIEARGDLSNTLCLCKIHDPLFEHGYFSFYDDFTIVKKKGVNSMTIATILDRFTIFKKPLEIMPSVKYLQIHRARTGLS